jgi:hypothetical protein
MIAPRIVSSKAAVLIHAWYFRMMNSGSPLILDANIRYIDRPSFGMGKFEITLSLC